MNLNHELFSEHLLNCIPEGYIDSSLDYIDNLFSTYGRGLYHYTFLVPMYQGVLSSDINMEDKPVFVKLSLPIILRELRKLNPDSGFSDRMFFLVNYHYKDDFFEIVTHKFDKKPFSIELTGTTIRANLAAMMDEGIGSTIETDIADIVTRYVISPVKSELS